MEQKRKTIEWHPAFTASLQIEFEDEADKIIFESDRKSTRLNSSH